MTDRRMLEHASHDCGVGRSVTRAPEGLLHDRPGGFPMWLRQDLLLKGDSYKMLRDLFFYAGQ
ncbi:hypothetical protein F6B41_27575 [Microbacterium lushaniae]|nr:hypothetical protein F6B41_27575 [Microbacterium lushaniae]